MKFLGIEVCFIFKKSIVNIKVINKIKIGKFGKLWNFKV